MANAKQTQAKAKQKPKEDPKVNPVQIKGIPGGIKVNDTAYMLDELSPQGKHIVEQMQRIEEEAEPLRLKLETLDAARMFYAGEFLKGIQPSEENQNGD